MTPRQSEASSGTEPCPTGSWRFTRRRFCASVTVASIASLGAPRGAWADDATVRVASAADLQAALRNARPGLGIQIMPGRYVGRFSAAGLRGEAADLVSITGIDDAGGNPPVIVGGIHLVNPGMVGIGRLIIETDAGNAINVDDGGSMKQTAQGVYLQDVHVRRAQARGNFDGIKLSGVKNFAVKDCTIEHWGSGGSGIDMVGCADGTIENCTLRHDPKTPPASGVQCKGGTRDVTITGCRFEHAGQRAVNIGGSTGLAFFRPQLPAGYEAKDITVHGCTFIGSDAPVAFVGSVGGLVERNTIYRPRRWVMRILQETKAEGFEPCRDGRFERNLIVFRSDEVRTTVNVGPDTAPDTFRFAGNWWYCIDRPDASEPRLPTAERDAVVGVDPKLRDPEAGDFTVAEGSAASDVGAPIRATGEEQRRDGPGRIR